MGHGGVYIHSRLLWGMACEARDRAAAAVANNPDVWPADATIAVVMAAVSAEAFINELAALLVMRRDSGHCDLAPPLGACADALEEIEASRGSLLLKYLVAFSTLGGRPVDKGANPYQDFATLLKIRNDLVHLKPRDTFGHSPEASPAVNWPKHIEALETRGLVRPRQGRTVMSWFNALQTQETARWACLTALNIILAILSLIPAEAAGPMESLKGLFRAASRQEEGHGAA